MFTKKDKTKVRAATQRSGKSGSQYVTQQMKRELRTHPDI